MYPPVRDAYRSARVVNSLGKMDLGGSNVSGSALGSGSKSGLGSDALEEEG